MAAPINTFEGTPAEEARLSPYAQELERLDTIPGVSRRVAQVLLGEIGVDLGRFPSAAYLASWAGMCPVESGECGRTGRGEDA